MSKRAHEIQAGIVIVVGLVILALGLFLVSGGADQFADKSEYTVLFSDAGGIAPGDTVTLAGAKVGSVADVRTVVDDKGEQQVQVSITVFADSVIKQDSEINIVTTITGTVSMAIQFGKGDRVAPGATLRGTKMATVSEVIDRADKTFASVETELKAALRDAGSAMKRLDNILAEVERQELGAQATAVLARFQGVGAEAQKLVQNAQEPMRLTLADIQAAAASLRKTLTAIEKDYTGELAPKLKSAVSSLDEALDKAKGIVMENREDIRLAIQNIADASQKIGPTLNSIQSFSRRLDKTIGALRPRLVATVDNARRAMRNFEDLTDDLKTAPWKLINKPSKKEVAQVALLNSLRLWTRGVQDIAEEVDRLEEFLAGTELEGEEREKVVRAILDRLETSLAEYDRRWKEVSRKLVEAQQK